MFKMQSESEMIAAVLHNVVEAVHRQFRKVTKLRSIFPNDDGGGAGLNLMDFPHY